MYRVKHDGRFDPKLATHLESVVEASQNLHEFVRFFVPKCGKSVELKFLYYHGFEVIGCEDGLQTCQEFFGENKLDFKRTGGNPIEKKFSFIKDYISLKALALP